MQVKYLAYLCAWDFHSGVSLALHFPNSFPERKRKTMKLTTYLNYGGNCAEALHFYEEHLGGKIVTMQTFDQMPEPKNIPSGLEKASSTPASSSAIRS